MNVLPLPDGASAAIGSGTGGGAGAAGAGAAGGEGGAGAVGAGAIGVGAAGAGAIGVGAAGAGASTSVPAGAITASTAPTSTVSPSPTRILATIPSPGLGTSVSTLSVEISSRGSSCAIASPSCLSQRVIVPSETDTPIWGITTSIWVPVDTLVLLVRRELAESRDDVVDLGDEIGRASCRERV